MRVRYGAAERETLRAIPPLPAYAAYYKRWGQRYHVASVPFLFILLPAAALALAAVLSRAGPGSPVRLTAAWSCLLAALVVVSFMGPALPILVAVPPLVFVSARVCSRWPAATVGFAFLLTGTFNTVEAFTPIPTGQAVDVVLAGLWAATIWHYVFIRRDRPCTRRRASSRRQP